MSNPSMVGDLPPITATMARELAIAERVCASGPWFAGPGPGHWLGHHGRDPVWVDAGFGLPSVCR